MSKSITAYIGLGSNLGNRLQNLQLALNYIKKQNDVFAVSSIYCNPPVGFTADIDFYNAVIGIKTDFEPLGLLEFLKTIERDMGRKKNNSEKYESRIIDLDILDYNGEIYKSSQLELPHKEIQFRSFVLLPLLEISPNWLHPVFNKNLIHFEDLPLANDLCIKLDEKIA